MMHVHIDWTTRDCDGIMSGSYVIEKAPDFDEDQYDFEAKVLMSVMNLSFNPKTEGPGKLTIERTNNAQTPMILNWSINLEEGWEERKAVFCNGDDITPPTRRDHTAERAGY